MEQEEAKDQTFTLCIAQSIIKNHGEADMIAMYTDEKIREWQQKDMQLLVAVWSKVLQTLNSAFHWTFPLALI